MDEITWSSPGWSCPSIIPTDQDKVDPLSIQETVSGKQIGSEPLLGNNLEPMSRAAFLLLYMGRQQRLKCDYHGSFLHSDFTLPGTKPIPSCRKRHTDY